MTTIEAVGPIRLTLIEGEHRMPRETMATLRAKLAEVETMNTALIEDARQAQSELGAAERRYEALDPEARLYAVCVAAVERYRADMARASSRSNTNTMAPRYWDDLPAAHQSPEGRLLLALAVRYNVPLEPPAPPAPTPTLADEGQSLLLAPSPLAEAIEQLIQNNYGDLGRIRPR